LDLMKRKLVQHGAYIRYQLSISIPSLNVAHYLHHLQGIPLK
jgi:hypothetical protein